MDHIKTFEGFMESTNSVDALLLAVKKQWAKKFPKAEWELEPITTQSYDSFTYNGFELSFKLTEQNHWKRFIRLVKITEPSLISKNKNYKLSVYFYNIVNAYEQPTADNNPTLDTYLEKLPTDKELKKIIDTAHKNSNPYFMK